LDGKDIRIFSEIAFRDLSYRATTQRHVSPSEVGKKLGLDEKTVRARIKKMEEDGFIKYYQAMPSLALFGSAFIGLFRFEAMNITTKRKLLQSFQQISHVVEAMDYVGPTISVVISGETEKGVLLSAAEIARRFELTNLSLGARAVRNPGIHIDSLDWQLIQKLRYDARMPATEIAKSLGITPRMAEYRIGKLLDQGALLIRAVIDPQKQSGVVFYEMEVSVEEGMRSKIIDALHERQGEKLLSASSPSHGLVLANMFGFTLGETENSALDAQTIQGVRYCHLYIQKEVVEPAKPNWLDRLIEGKLEV